MSPRSPILDKVKTPRVADRSVVGGGITLRAPGKVRRPPRWWATLLRAVHRRRSPSVFDVCLVAVALLVLFRALRSRSAPKTLSSGAGSSSDSRVESFAFATFFGSDDFLPAIQVLLYTLGQTAPAYPLVMCVLDGSVSDAALSTALRTAPEFLKVRIRRWAPVPPPKGSAHAPRWGVNWSKLRLWQLTEYERVLYIDADTMVLQNLDDVFDAVPLPSPVMRTASARGPLPADVTPMSVFAGTPDWGKWTRPGSTKMNAGVFLFTPSAATFAALLNASVDVAAYRSLEAEQGLLNAFFGDAHCCLSHTLNAQKTLSALYPDLLDMAAVRVLHFTGAKPWRCWRRSGECAGVYQQLDMRPGAQEPDDPPPDSREMRPSLVLTAGAPDEAPVGALSPVQGFADLVDTEDFGELHAMWRATYLRIRHLGSTLALFDASASHVDSAAAMPIASNSHNGEQPNHVGSQPTVLIDSSLDYTGPQEASGGATSGGDGAASLSAWPVPLQELPPALTHMAPLVALARLASVHGADLPKAPFIGLVDGAPDSDPPNWSHIHLGPSSVSSKAASHDGSECFAWSTQSISSLMGGTTDVLLQAARTITPQLPFLVDTATLMAALGPMHGHIPAGAYVRSQALIMKTALWANFSHFLDGVTSRVSPALSGSNPILGSTANAPVTELLLNAWLASSQIGCVVVVD